MNKSNFYKNEFLEASNRIQYVLDHSNLPGPRGNLELMFAVQDVGDELFFKKCLEHNELKAPTNTPGEFVGAFSS